MNESLDLKEHSCPFCGCANHVELKKKEKFIFPHPPDPFIHKGEERKFSKNRFEFWKPKHYEGEREKYLICEQCGYRYHVILSPVPKNQYDNEIKYFLELSEEGKIKEKRLFIEKILDLFDKKFHLPRFLGCLAIVLFLWIVWALLVIISGGLPKLVHDWSIPINIGAITFMFYFIDRHFKIVREVFAAEKIPIKSKMNLFLSEKYKEVILGNPFKKRLYPSTADIIFAIAMIVFNFILGNSFWAAVCTAAVINQIGNGARLKSNILKDGERLEDFGRLSISSLLHTSPRKPRPSGRDELAKAFYILPHILLFR